MAPRRAGGLGGLLRAGAAPGRSCAWLPGPRPRALPGYAPNLLPLPRLAWRRRRALAAGGETPCGPGPE
eukprot:11198877-Lingulodinium_polyedra.AAC.1